MSSFNSLIPSYLRSPTASRMKSQSSEAAVTEEDEVSGKDRASSDFLRTLGPLPPLCSLGTLETAGSLVSFAPFVSEGRGAGAASKATGAPDIGVELEPTGCTDWGDEDDL